MGEEGYLLLWERLALSVPVQGRHRPARRNLANSVALPKTVLLGQLSRPLAFAGSCFRMLMSAERQAGAAGGHPAHSARRYAASQAGAANLRGTASSPVGSPCQTSACGIISFVKIVGAHPRAA